MNFKIYSRSHSILSTLYPPPPFWPVATRKPTGTSNNDFSFDFSDEIYTISQYLILQANTHN